MATIKERNQPRFERLVREHPNCTKHDCLHCFYINNKEYTLSHDTINCIENECQLCAVLLCPFAEPFHFHHDGCPLCDYCPEI